MRLGFSVSLRLAIILLSIASAGEEAYATTAYYTAVGTATSSAGSTGPVSVGINFVTSANQVTVTIHNYIVGASLDVQGVAAVDFVLSGGQTTGTIASQTGLVRTINTNGTWSAPSTGSNFSAGYAGRWIVQAGGGLVNPVAGSVDLTAFSGGSPTMTVFGAADHATANCCYKDYGLPSNAVTKHDPYLTTDGQDVIFTLNIAGVTAADTVNSQKVRFFFGTDRTAFLAGAQTIPEVSTFSLIGLGLLLLGIPWTRKNRRVEECTGKAPTSPP